MHKPLNPITRMLIEQMREVKLLINDVQGKIAEVDVDEVLKKNKEKSSKS